MSIRTLNAKQLACLSSPARNEVFMRLRTLGRASIADIARDLEKKPEAVHYHVKALLAAGLAKEAFKRSGVKKPEWVYESVGNKWRLPKARPGSEVAVQSRKAVLAGFRQVARGYQRAAEASERDPKLRAKMHAIRMNVRLKPSDARAFIDLIENAVAFADERRDEAGARLIWSSIVFPDLPRKKLQ